MCHSCKAGDEHLCESPLTLGIYQDGGYPDLMLVTNYKHLIKLENVDFNSSAALVCSGLTAYSSIQKSLAMPGETLLITGAGGLELMAVQIVKAITNSNILIMDVNDKKKRQKS
jgi:alcohol dehydrogenase, propanol-preferring